MTVLSPAFAGFGTGAGLIVAIGAQNAFVLRSGLLRRSVLPVVLVCLVSDIILITAGVAGMGALTSRAPWFIDVVRWVGVAFLVAYAILSLRRSVRPGSLDSASGTDGQDLTSHSAANPKPTSLLTTSRAVSPATRRAVLTAAALTWLNPHVYLDTMVLVGSLAATHGDPGRWGFGAGAALASAVWFPLIGFGAMRLHRYLASPKAWRVIDVLIALQLLVVAAALARG